MKKFLILISLFFIEPVFSYENVGDYKKLKFVDYLDYSGLRIIESVDLSKKPYFFIKENTPTCKSKGFLGYLSHQQWQRSDADLVVCTRNIYFYTLGDINKDFVHEIKDTVRHEAVHAAQLCKQGNFLLGVDQRRFEGYPKRMVYTYYKNSSNFEKKLELEAFALEDDPYFVLNSVNRYCL